MNQQTEDSNTIMITIYDDFTFYNTFRRINHNVVKL